MQKCNAYLILSNKLHVEDPWLVVEPHEYVTYYQLQNAPNNTQPQFHFHLKWVCYDCNELSKVNKRCLPLAGWSSTCTWVPTVCMHTHVSAFVAHNKVNRFCTTQKLALRQTMQSCWQKINSGSSESLMPWFEGICDIMCMRLMPLAVTVLINIKKTKSNNHASTFETVKKKDFHWTLSRTFKASMSLPSSCAVRDWATG